jgi:cytochrome c nitrite reductase small subunit
MKLQTLQFIVMGLGLGLVAGVGGYTFVYAKGYSYLTNNPAACVNCHVMREQYDGWVKSSHRNAATCNDCHTPANLVGKYATKASNGFWHSYYFTSGSFPEPIRITERSRQITEQSCRKCHAEITQAIEGPHRPGQETECLRCHNSVGHKQ